MITTRDLHSWPEWWACVANYEFFDEAEEMTRADELVLFETARRLSATVSRRARPPRMPVTLVDDPSLSSRPLPHRFSEGKNPFDFAEGHVDYEAAVSSTMERARFMGFVTIRSVLEGHSADIAGIRQTHPRRLAWIDERHRVHTLDDTEDPLTISFQELFREGRRFPLAQCKNTACGRVFAWVGPQKFCSATCQSRFREAARSGTERRKETLRRASREYRERQREAARGARNRKRRS